MYKLFILKIKTFYRDLYEVEGDIKIDALPNVEKMYVI